MKKDLSINFLMLKEEMKVKSEIVRKHFVANQRSKDMPEKYRIIEGEVNKLSNRESKQPPIRDWGHFCLGCKAA